MQDPHETHALATTDYLKTRLRQVVQKSNRRKSALKALTSAYVCSQYQVRVLSDRLKGLEKENRDLWHDYDLKNPAKKWWQFKF